MKIPWPFRKKKKKRFTPVPPGIYSMRIKSMVRTQDGRIITTLEHDGGKHKGKKMYIRRLVDRI